MDSIQLYKYFFIYRKFDVFTEKTVKLVAILSICTVLEFFIFIPLSNDDLTYFKEQSFSLDWLINERYLSWSSRILLESVLPFFCENEFFFRIVSLLFVLLNIYSLKKIFYELSYSQVLLFLSLIPFYNLVSAGLVATTVNYYYPSVLGFYILSVLFRDEKSSIIRLFLVIFSCLIATNQEQMSLFLLIISAIFIFKNDHKRIAFLVFFISILGLLNNLLCPGNYVRLIAETDKWMPEFSEYSFFNKVYLGISSTLYFLNFSEPFFLVLFVSFLSFFYKRNLWFVIGILIAIYLILRLPVRMDLKSANVMLDGTFIYRFPTISLLILLLFDFFILFFILKIGLNLNQKSILIGLFVLANMLRASVGFSPTVFASLSRPSILSEIIIVLACMFLYSSRNVLFKDNCSLINKISLLLCCFALYSNIKTFVTIIG